MAPSIVHEQSDTDLITAVRGGDNAAFGLLFARHRGAADRLARQLTSSGEADDLVSEAFIKVLAQLQAGKGPDTAFRAYLLTAIRRLHVDRIRSQKRVEVTDEPSRLDPGQEFFDTAVAGFEQGTAAKAFASLPERWQVALWHVDVEGQRPAEVADVLGMSANSVSALLYRAREGLRQAYLQAHLSEAPTTSCRWTNERLGSHVRGGLSHRDTGKVEDHLDDCRRCMGVYLELREVASDLRAVLGPVVLGGAWVGYATVAGAAQKGLFLVAWESVRATAGQPGRLAGSGVQAAATVAVVGVLATAGTLAAVRGPELLAAQNDGPSESFEAAPSQVSEAPATDPAPSAPSPTPSPSPSDEPEDVPDAPQSTSPSPSPTPSASATPDPAPSPSPSPSPTQAPPADTDFGIVSASAPDYGRFLQKLVTVEFSADTTGGAAREHEVVATIDFDSPVIYRGTRAGAWTCEARERQTLSTLRCTTTASTSLPTLEVKAQRLGPVSGSVRITSSPNSDPDSSNDSARF